MRSALIVTMLLFILPAGGRPGGGVPQTPEAILGRMARTYATAASYRDRGEVVEDDSLPWRAWLYIARGSDHDTFSTAFTRAAGLNFTYRYSRGRVWHARSARQMAAVAGVTHGVSEIVPRLLLATPAAWNVAAIEHPALRRTEAIADRTCDVVTGTHSGQTVTLWIDRTSYLLRRVRIGPATIEYQSADALNR